MNRHQQDRHQRKASARGAELLPINAVPAAGHGAEAFIGQLTLLWSLHIELFSWRRIDAVPQLSCGAAGSEFVLLQPQLQLLGCNAAAGESGGDGGGGPVCSTSAGSKSAKRNMGLQELSLKYSNRLSDDELAAAAAALPDLRRLKVVGSKVSGGMNEVQGFSGAGLAAFTACRRLRDITLACGNDLEGQQLVAHLPRLASLTRVELRRSPGVDGSTIAELQAAFQAKHGRQLSVACWRDSIYSTW
jgi:hypothetical protein